jgi:flagellin
MDRTMERLSSGFRINRASDDAAGLAISEKLKAQVRGLTQASRNALDGISMIQTAESGLDEVQNIMHRMRELAVQSSNDTLGTTERRAVFAELNQLRQEVTSITDRTQFNNQSLLDGSRSNALVANDSDFAAGDAIATSGTIDKIDVSGARPGKFYEIAESGGNVTITEYDDFDGTTYTGATGRASTLAVAEVVDGETATLDFAAVGIKFEVSADGADTTGLAAALAGGLKVDGAAELQTGANASDYTTVNFVNVDIQSDTADSSLIAVNDAIDAFSAALGTGATAERQSAKDLMDSLDTALDFISEQRAGLGAAQNRLEHSISNTKAAAENLASSNSRIRDVDVAEESSQMARTQVLLQAGVSVLAQSNQMSQMALKLLG